MKRLIFAALLALFLISCDERQQTDPQIHKEPLSKKLKDSSHELSDKLKNKVDSAGESLNEQIDQINKSFVEAIERSQFEITNARYWSEEKLNEFLSEIKRSEPALAEGGYKITGIAVLIGLSPGCVVTCQQTRQLSESDERALLEKHRDRSLLSIMLKTLFKSSKLDLGQYKIKETVIYMTTIPKVKLNLLLEGDKP